MAASVDGEERVIAAAQQIVRSLGTSKNMKEDILLILSNFDNRLSNIKIRDGGNSRLAAAEDVIRRWGDCPLPWDDSPEEVDEYLAAVDDVISLAEGNGGDGDEDSEILDRAESVLQTAMEKLEEDFRWILIQNTEPMDTARLYESSRSMSASFAAGAAISVDEFESYAEDERGGAYASGRSFRGSFVDDLPIEIVKPDAIPHLQSIAERMIRAKYEKECCQIYSCVRRDFLEQSISSLGIEKMSIEEVHKIAWTELDGMMKKWAQALKIVFEYLLSGEKKLCDQIFEISPSVGEISFAETVKGSVMQLLNFAEAVTIGEKSPEKLIRILDMYDALYSVIPEFPFLFPEELRGFLLGEADSILARLGDAAKETLAVFENAVQTDSSRRFQLGDIHPLTRYVMNYLKVVMDYEATLDKLLGDEDRDLKNEEDNPFSGTMSKLGRRVLSAISSLESNIGEKARLYEDLGLHYVFLMNNTRYIVDKVKKSELRTVVGDDWIRKRGGQIRQHARGYLRASWYNIVNLTRDDGSGGHGGGSAYKAALKERFKNFNAAFEEICRTQSAWKVADPQMREELRVQISDMLIPAYRSLNSSFEKHLEGSRNSAKYRKYMPEDLDRYLSDLFEGSSSSGASSHSRRRH